MNGHTAALCDNNIRNLVSSYIKWFEPFSYVKKQFKVVATGPNEMVNRKYFTFVLHNLNKSLDLNENCIILLM